MKRFHKAKIQNSEATKYRWAFRMLIISMSLSIFFGYLSQTLLSTLGAIVASISIAFFIFISVLFDMIGIAAASADIETFETWQKTGVAGAKIGYKLCINSEKVCSFCADVVGDICSTLCGAGGACVVVSLTKNLSNINIETLITIFISALIAGLMVFFKALMKAKTLKNANKIILKLGLIFEKTIYKEKKIKNFDKNIDK